MSESDDTDVLLLIPPDIFHVPSSETSSSDSPRADCGKTGVISELVGHMQTLESRISAIESRDNSLDVSALNNSLDSQQVYGSASYPYYRQTLPRLSVSQSASLQNTPVKHRKPLSVPSTPNGYSTQNYTNLVKNDMKSGCYLSTAATSNLTTTNTLTRAKHDTLTLYSDSFVVPSSSCGTELSHATAMSMKKESHLSLRPNDYCQQHTRTRIVQEMELSEVDELLQEMEATELELSKRINNSNRYQYNELVHPLLPTQTIDASNNQEKETQHKLGAYKKLSFLPCSKEPQFTDTLSAFSQKKSNNAFPDISLPYSESFQLNESNKMISEFKTWEQSAQQPTLKANGHTIENSIKNVDHLSNVSSITIDNAKSKEAMSNQNSVMKSEASTNNVHVQSKDSITDPLLHVSESTKLPDAKPLRPAQYSSTEHLLNPCKTPQHNGSVHDDKSEKSVFSKSAVHVATNTDSHLRKYQRILSLSDFWETHPARSQEETLRIKLEEEKFRREHCEHLIQELQKRLLEQQEKVAVAVRIDNEKNVLISQFHVAWSKLKQQVAILEVEHKNSQTNLQNITEKHQSEIAKFQTQIKELEEKLSKTLDLAAGYKEKSDTTIKEKVDLLKTYADELESYKLLVQEAENRYEQIKIEFNKLLEKNQQNEETLKIVQSELNKERLRGSEVRSEMSVIHKALDTCEAELTVLRQEKENLQLKLKEEINRNSILEQKNSLLLESIDDSKKAEKLAKDEIKSIVEQKEKIRAELQEVYQKQVDEVVKVKLQEFQTQLDTAESEFLEELKTRQQVIAECAARKIKDVIDKHRLEINLLEEKHKEEKRLYELQLAQALQRSSMLETHLNSQRTTKSQLAEQLHSVMQKQWQQALHIISGGNTDNLSPIQKIYANKHFDSKGPKKSESMPNCHTKLSQEPIRYATQSLETQNPVQLLEDQNESVIINSNDNTPLTSRKESKNDLRKYVKMIAEMQLAKEDRDAKSRSSISSPPLECREVPRKHYLKKELSIMSEDSIMWQPTSETSHDLSEHVSLPQKMITKLDQQRSKPPWK
ncbi:serine/threonine-protein kinase dst2-like isoform X4 [Cataglyphis hispanica]|uniref:serine/threonine-protein kinase dst2-like isoform X4 n=2 Tax=Cataglyphis hispanica TaxID=1086592 RepID=UPI002180146C|nr:serine/threonine-protein kinase dst2-like isoform X4 [Cataglyphis hispanica]